MLPMKKLSYLLLALALIGCTLPLPRAPTYTPKPPSARASAAEAERIPTRTSLPALGVPPGHTSSPTHDPPPTDTPPPAAEAQQTDVPPPSAEPTTTDAPLPTPELPPTSTSSPMADATPTGQCHRTSEPTPTDTSRPESETLPTRTLRPTYTLLPTRTPPPTATSLPTPTPPPSPTVLPTVQRPANYSGLTKDFGVALDCGGVSIIVTSFAAGSRDYVAGLVPARQRLLFRLAVDRKDITLGWLGVAVENRTNGVASVYPDGGTLVVGPERIRLGEYTDLTGEMGGEIRPGIRREGLVAFGLEEIPITEIDSVLYIVGGARDADGNALCGEDYVFELDLSDAQVQQ